MNIGNGCVISDKWIPNGIFTGIKDINGDEIKTADKVKLNGCMAEYAVVGFDMQNKPVIFFGGNSGSVSWKLTQERVKELKIRKI